MTTTKHTYKFVKQEFEKRGYTLISNEYIRMNMKLRYICNKHSEKGEQEISFSKFYHSNQGCKYCGRERTIASRKATINKQEDQLLCAAHDFTYIDTIIENHVVKIKFICNKHQNLGIQTMNKSNMKRQIKGCQYCSGKNLPKWYIADLIQKRNPTLDILDEYSKLTDRVKCKCKIHNIVTIKSIQEILHGKGCYYCGIEKLAQYHLLTLKEYQNRVSQENKDVMVLEYSGQKNNAKFKCALCGHEWYGSAGSMINNGVSCPECTRYYRGEKTIKLLLDKWGYDYKQQYKFTDCRDKRLLSFDFYLAKHNTCIEYDGKQHFDEVWKGKNNFAITVKHDQIKNQYCRQNKIHLIRIPYFCEDIEYELFDKMANLGIIEEIQIT